MAANDVASGSGKIEYRLLKLPNEVYKHFLVEFKNDRKTEFRKCMRCSTVVKAVNGGTSAMLKHISNCKGPTKVLVSEQRTLNMPRKAVLAARKGVVRVARLVYEDHIPLNTVVRSETLQYFYRCLGFAKVSYHSVSEVLDEDYHYLISKIKDKIEARDKKQILVMSFDKWTSTTNQKFLGVYLYVSGEKICLGLIHFVGYCGAEEISVLLKNRLAIFGLIPSDISLFVTDCGSDVQNTAEIFNAYKFPCLAHVINLCVKKFLLDVANFNETFR